MGEAPRAFVVPRLDEHGSPHKIDPDEVAAFIKPKVSEHKWLVGGVEVVADLPKNHLGKFLRRELKAAYLKRSNEKQQ